MRLLVAATTLLLLAPSVAAAQEPAALATTFGDRTVSAAGGWTTWTEQYNEGVYGVAVRAPGGSVTRPSLPQGSYGADLGIDGGGSAVAASTTWCAPGRRCVITIHAFATGAQRTVPLPRGVRQVTMASVGGNRVAYLTSTKRARTVRRRVSGRVRRVRERSLGAIRVHDLATGRDRLLAHGPFLPVGGDRSGQALSLDFDGRTVAVTWFTSPPQVSPGPMAGRTWEIRRYGPDGSSRRVVRTISGSPASTVCEPALAGPTVTPAGVTFVQQFAEGWSAQRGAGRSATFGPGHAAAAGGEAPRILSAAVDGGRLVVAERDRESGAPTEINEYRLGAFTSTSRFTRCGRGG
jgi:hypothetical protein